MLHSISVLGKSIIFATILSLVNIVVSYIYTRNDCSTQINTVASYLKNVATSDNKEFTQSFGDNTAINLELLALKVSIDGASVYSFDGSNRGSIYQKFFPSTGEVSEPNFRASFEINTQSTALSFLIRILVSTIIIFLGCIAIASLAAKKAMNTLDRLRTAILNHQYEDIEFDDLSKELCTNESKFKHDLEDAAKKIEHLESASTLDILTGLYNRSAFRQQFDKLMSSKDKNQVNMLGIIRASELQQINSERGFQVGDCYIRDLASLLKDTLSHFPQAMAYRISGSDIAIIQPKADEENIKRINEELLSLVIEYQKSHSMSCVCYSGYTLFTADEKTETILSRADLALALAQTGPANGYYIQKENTEDYLQGEIHWRETILDILNRQAIKLYYQPIKSMNISIHTYVEIFARFSTKDGETLSTETVLAAAQRHDLLIRLEEMIIENIIAKFYAVNDKSIRFGINLSANALISTSFLLWLERTLLRHSEIAANLVFEINEEILESNNLGAQRLFSIIRRAGSFTSISHFGKGIESFRIYRELKPNYIKLDPNLCQSFEKDLTSQQFVRMIIEVSHRLGCVVVAEGIETTLQKQHIENLYVDAIQGYLIAQPEELIDNVKIDLKPTWQRKNAPQDFFS